MNLDAWQQRSLAFQLTSIVADLRRAAHQRSLGSMASVQSCLETALENADRTLMVHRGFTKRRELARLRELIADQLLDRPTYPIALTDLIRTLDPYGLIVARERGLT